MIKIFNIARFLKIKKFKNIEKYKILIFFKKHPQP